MSKEECCSCNPDVICGDDMDSEFAFCPCKMGKCDCKCHKDEKSFMPKLTLNSSMWSDQRE